MLSRQGMSHVPDGMRSNHTAADAPEHRQPLTVLLYRAPYLFDFKTLQP